MSAGLDPTVFYLLMAIVFVVLLAICVFGRNKYKEGEERDMPKFLEEGDAVTMWSSDVAKSSSTPQMDVTDACFLPQRNITKVHFNVTKTLCFFKVAELQNSFPGPRTGNCSLQNPQST